MNFLINFFNLNSIQALAKNENVVASHDQQVNSAPVVSEEEKLLNTPHLLKNL